MNTLENAVLDAFAVEVLDILAPALPLAVAEFEVGVPVLAVTFDVNCELEDAFKFAELPIPLTVTSLLSVVAAESFRPVLAALNEPLITPLAASLDAELELNSDEADCCVAIFVSLNNAVDVLLVAVVAAVSISVAFLLLMPAVHHEYFSVIWAVVDVLLSSAAFENISDELFPTTLETVFST
jgi:hypothetical protein